MENVITINCDDIMSSDEHDYQPEFVEMYFTPESINAIETAVTALKENRCFGYIAIEGINFEVDDQYEGKASLGRLIIRLIGGNPNFKFEFTNVWSGTEYWVDLLDEIAQPLYLSAMGRPS